MTSLPPTLSSPPTSHSIWIESAISSLPSSLAEEPTIVSRGPSLDFGPAELSCYPIIVGGLLLFRPSIAASSGAAASASCPVPRAGLRDRARGVGRLLSRTRRVGCTALPALPGHGVCSMRSRKVSTLDFPQPRVRAISLHSGRFLTPR